MTNNLALQMTDIEKQFAGVYALKGVQLSLKKGEVHALLGENGAGKSTLIKILGGIYKADGGKIFINGNEIKIHSVKDASEHGISIIHQEIVLVPHISVTENIFLGREKLNKLGLKDMKRMNELAKDMIHSFGLDIDVTTKVSNLSIAQQQMVEIIKAVSFNAKIIVMDEPTSSLAEKEVEHLFQIIKKLQEKEVSVIYISHKLNELFAITDRITVLRDGSYIDTKITKETTMDELISLMVGRELTEYYTRSEHIIGETAFEIKNLNKKKVFSDVSFRIRKGEIVGFAGLVGAGRSEIMKAIFGVDSLDSGEIFINGEKVKIKSVGDAIQKKIALIPEDRKKEGLILSNSVDFNMTITIQDQYKKGIIVNETKKNEIVNKYLNAFSIKAASTRQIINNLSGGNQQKVVLAKWLATQPEILILDEPTRGVDVGAKAEIYTIIDKLANDGMAVLLISSELPELINMCDRIYVVSEGRITGELSRDEFSQQRIMYLATGGSQE